MILKVASNTSALTLMGFLFFSDFEASAQTQQTEANQAVEKVVVLGERNEYSGLREVLAGKIVLGRAWLDRSAASTVAEALRRESSVSVNAGGKISLKGLAGYTQILLDGQVASGSINPLQMDPALIERVEIIHSASADSGAFGLAGTINVVTRNRRKALPKQLSLNGGSDGHGNRAGVNLQSGWREDAGTIFNITGNATSSQSELAGDAIWSWLDANDTNVGSVESTLSKAASQQFSLSPSMTWKLTPSDELQLNASVSAVVDKYRNQSHLIKGPTLDNGGSRPQATQLVDENRTNYVSLDTQWRNKLANEGTSTIRIDFTQERIEQNRDANTTWTPSLFNQLGVAETSVKNYLKGRWLVAMPNREGHRLQFALSSDIFLQKQNQSTMINHVLAGGDWLGSYRADLWSWNTAAWVQDNWKVSETLDLKLGWRQEHRTNRWESAEIQSKVGANLSAPSLNLAWKLDPEGERTITLGLARSFSNIGPAMLSPRPSIAGTSLCTSNEKCGTNDPNQPDRAGNPALKYESGWGLDGALERQFGEASQWNLRGYYRWIKDGFAWITQRENVAWAHSPRWVSRPMNVGSASAFGITLGVDTELSDWMENAPEVNINSSLQWNHSRLSTIQGPDNRIEGQQPWSGRLALSYKPEGKPLEIQADLLLNPAQWWQASRDTRIYTATHKEMSAKAIWTFSPQQKLILSLQNMLSAQSRTLTLYSADRVIQKLARQRHRTYLSVRFETQFE